MPCHKANASNSSLLTSLVCFSFQNSLNLCFSDILLVSPLIFLLFFFLIFFPDNLDEALDQLTQAVLLNPHSAILYATRGTLSHLLCVHLCIYSYQNWMPFGKFLSVMFFRALLFLLAFWIIWEPQFLVFSKRLYEIEETKCCYTWCWHCLEGSFYSWIVA